MMRFCSVEEKTTALEVSDESHLVPGKASVRPLRGDSPLCPAFPVSLARIGLIHHELQYTSSLRSGAGTWKVAHANNNTKVFRSEMDDAEHSRPSSQASDSSTCHSASSSTATTVSVSSDERVLKVDETAKYPILSSTSLGTALRHNSNYPRSLQDDADVDLQRSDGKNMAHISTITGDVPLLQDVAPMESTPYRYSQGMSPLDYAALKNHLESIQYLVETETFRCLTAERKIDALGRALECAERKGYNRVANYLSTKQKAVQRTQTLRALQNAVFDNNLQLVKRLAEYNINRLVALNIASARGQGELVMSLLEGMETDADRKEGSKSAYLSSLDFGHLEVCQMLVLHGEVDIDFAIVAAAQHQHWEMFRWLMKVDGDMASYNVSILSQEMERESCLME